MTLQNEQMDASMLLPSLDNSCSSLASSEFSFNSDDTLAPKELDDNSSSSFAEKDKYCEKGSKMKTSESTAKHGGPSFVEVTKNDILCGRGGFTNNHDGNRRFRKLIDAHRQEYVDASKSKKPQVGRKLVNDILLGTPKGRFLKKDNKSGEWYEISFREASAKASQALREKKRNSINNRNVYH